jgi:hypothetical protein
MLLAEACNVHLYVHVCMHVCMYVCVNVCMYVCTCVRLCVGLRPNRRLTPSRTALVRRGSTAGAKIYRQTHTYFILF